MLFRPQSLVAFLAAVAITQATVSNPRIVGRQVVDDGLLAIDSTTDNSPPESSTTEPPSDTSTSVTPTPTESPSSSTTSDPPPPTTTTTSSTTTTSEEKPTSSTTTSEPSKSTTSPTTSKEPGTTPSSTPPPQTTPPQTNDTPQPTSSSTQSSPSPTNTATLTNNGNVSGGGMNTKTKNTIIGVVVGVGGFIVLAALGLVAYRIWGRKKVDEDNDGLMSYQIGSVGGPEKTGSSSGGAANNPFQSTLETYHNPARNVNASSNF